MATEKRLVDANAIVVPKYDMDGRDLFNQGYCQGKTDGILEVKVLAPTVDAVEVVHGRWEDAYGGKYANPRYRCSVCKEKALYKFERDVLGNNKDVQALTPYCPQCNAKMDGDGNV